MACSPHNYLLKIINITVIKEEKKLLLIASTFLIASVVFGYGLARIAANKTGVHTREDALELIEKTKGSSSDFSDINQRLEISTGKSYDALITSWNDQTTDQIISKNIALALSIAVFSVIPLTGFFALYKEVTIGIGIGFNEGLVAATGGGHLRMLLALPHMLFEIPAILLTTALALRVGIIVIKKSYDHKLLNRIFIAYGRWLEVAPLLIVLFLLAGLVEGIITPNLVRNLLAP